jgi:hypothetical protein
MKNENINISQPGLEPAPKLQSLIQTLRTILPDLPPAPPPPPDSEPQSDGDDHYDHARIGKVARLPADVREIVNLMLYENAPYAAIIEKLAALGHPGFAPCNFSRWKDGGYRHWVYRRQQAEALRVSSKTNLELLQQLTPHEQHSLHQVLELTFLNQMLSALAHVNFNFNLDHKDADTLAKLGNAIARHFRERTRYEWLQMTRRQQADDAVAPPSPPQQ